MNNQEQIVAPSGTNVVGKDVDKKLTELESEMRKLAQVTTALLEEFEMFVAHLEFVLIPTESSDEKAVSAPEEPAPATARALQIRAERRTLQKLRENMSEVCLRLEA